jgi:hypothetical protein
LDFASIELLEKNKTWDINIDGEERKQLETHLLKIKEEEREKIFLTAAKILSKCPDPNEKEGSTTGLALGKVQSGKTSSFISLTALAFDNKYRVVIILAGTKNNLLDQNKKRVHKQLNLDYRTDRKIASLTTLGNIDGVQEQEVSAILESGGNILITLLKHHEHINHISTIFSSPDLNYYPTLIIDDEGDQASLNNKRKKGQSSSTYREIRQLKNTFKLHGFVAFTATPQANLLIETLDDLSPEFCILIEPGSGYTGGSTFHGEDQEKYMRAIPEKEIPFEDVIPDSFLQALGDYFVGASIRTLRGDTDYHSMLVHTSVSKREHHNVGEMVRALIEKWKSSIILPNSDPARINVENILFARYKSLIENSDREYHDWPAVMDQIKKEMKHLRTWVVNSSPNAEVPTDRLNLKNNIFIGGNMLERGVTLEGLAITYLTRRAKESQADTVEQRARWFGYKESYLDVCRVYAPLDVIQGFANLLGDEDDLWATLKQNENENLDIKLWPRIIQCSAPFRPTRTSVASTKNVKYDKWIVQSKVELGTQRIKINLSVVEEFFNNFTFIDQDFGGTSHYIAKSCNLQEVYDYLVFNVSPEIEIDENLSTIKTMLKRILRLQVVPKIDIVFMNKKDSRERKYTNGKIDQIMQGSNKKYVGDRYLFNDPNASLSEFQLQVHILKPKNEENKVLVEKTVALALNIPDDIREGLGRLVRPSGR